ncbi:hypothetical protein GCM10010441_77430 [Kitasatospora paracochleata]|uniref:Uncharacterized protein n=1 Tax=Kitasatospora paracochleata TaxID=58354 RepID=A0ABT1J989_9ACTN|nr:hypothetical protein [Kitasatospora paracochleata]MCP2314019.1 hypothetical protein [Kitasatospora paracochleata]
MKDAVQSVKRFTDCHLPDDRCRECGAEDVPLTPGKPEPYGPGVERETCICAGCRRGKDRHDDPGDS